MANRSFETAHATNQGEAADWNIDGANHAESVGAFDADEHTWVAAEQFDGEWRIPFLVHYEADTVNTVATADATDLATALTLSNDIVTAYTDHVLLEGNVHHAVDLMHPITSAQAINLPTLISLVNELKLDLNAHFIWTEAHTKQDTPVVVSTADATDEASAILLVNSIKSSYNTHLSNTGSGGYAEDSIFAFTDALLDPGEMDGGLEYEDFENGWAIPDLLSSLKIQNQSDQVTAPDPWPGGHVQFLQYFNHVTSEMGITETFEDDWKLPGTSDGAVTNRFYFRYWTGTEWEFSEDQLHLAGVETFESDWSHNDVWAGKYWTGSAWEFDEVGGDLDTTGNITETFETDWTLTLD